MTYRSVFSFALMGVFFGGGLLTGVARAQGPQGAGPATPLPLVVDLKKVPVGSWSEYKIADGQNTMVVRMALVARAGQLAQVETEIKGGPVAALGRTIMRMALPTDDVAEVKPKEQVIQLGDNPPMTLPPEMTGGRAQTFKKLDPKKRVGVDSVTVPAGTFAKADHYQDKGANGETIDFWVTKTVMPFGLLKVTSSGVGSGKGVSMELTGHGGGAKPLITKTPQAFDKNAIMKQAQPAMPGAAAGSTAGGSAAPGAGGPPPRPIPSPHPGMPPTTGGGSSASAPHGAPAAKDAKK